MDRELLKDLCLAAPLIILGAGVILLLLLDAFRKRDWSPAGVSAGLLLVALLALGIFHTQIGPEQKIFGNFLYADPYSFFFSALILSGALLALLLGVRALKAEGIEDEPQYYALFLAATFGALLFAQSAELLMLFIGLETMSLALYCLCAGALRLRASCEAALKYFVLGSFSSAFLLFGIALLYALSGTTVIAEIAPAVSSRGTDHVFLFIAFGLLMVGLFFKLGAVPFHFWVPDTYQGAPTPVTAYMATVIKIAAIAASLRVLWGAFGEMIVFWQGAVWIVSLLSILYGNVVALRQRSLKRMLAYSSIAHAGYIMVAFLAPGEQFGGGPAILFYAVSYLLMSMGAFAAVLVVSSPHASGKNPDDISRFNGLGYRQPAIAAMFALFLLALAGLPPGMAGLFSKFYAFNAAIKAGYVALPVLGVIGAAISCYYYLRVIVAMYFVETQEQIPLPFDSCAALKLVLWICALGVVLLGVFPSYLYELSSSVMVFF